ncbi:MAG: demethoxyubiquinone hydroxylase family protein [Pseudomonadota bacterium]|nr:demethoxyubiquinone hydroxylase family protein [Pseudomonadota bacterium]
MSKETQTAKQQMENPRKALTEHGILPGDLPADKMLDRIVRVDHAGEYGAVRIYEGQLAVLGNSDKADVIRHMVEQEREHLEKFNELIGCRRVRPTALIPVWHAAGFALGAATALMGERAAMACTAAVEEVIDEHYANQAAKLGDDEAELRDTIEKFRADELEHRDTALHHEAEQTPGYEALSIVIKKGSRLAIWLSERV